MEIDNAAKPFIGKNGQGCLIVELFHLGSFAVMSVCHRPSNDSPDHEHSGVVRSVDAPPISDALVRSRFVAASNDVATVKTARFGKCNLPVESLYKLVKRQSERLEIAVSKQGYNATNASHAISTRKPFEHRLRPPHQKAAAVPQ